MTLLEDHSRAIAALPGDDDRLRLHLADTLGAWIAGAGTLEGRGLAGAGDPPLLDEGPLDRIAHAVAATRLTEIDDIHARSCTTCGSVVVPAALILAARVGADGALFARALRAGYETMMRFGVAVDGPSILYRGMWPTYLAAPIGAAASASVLLSLSPAQTANALAIALAQTSGAPGGPAPGKASRWL
ncbi:MAG: 2-methylcitrate dehydratase family protein, partial [Hyphomicrobiales bacterium]|nr:2-methylcitrate dehydratase family protein [Hyphomicrobiales bacterium]